MGPLSREWEEWRVKFPLCTFWGKYKLCVVLPPTSRATVPAEVPAELLATQLYWPASTSWTPRMCRVPRWTSCSTKGAEPTSSSPGNTEKQPTQLTGHFLFCFFYFRVHLVFNLNLPLNQWTRGGGTPVAWHSSVASPPTDTCMTGWVTVILGTSGDKMKGIFKEFN